MTTHVEDGALVRYLDRECETDELAAVETHLDTCVTCGTRAAALRRHSDAVSAALRVLDSTMPARRPARRWGLHAAIAALVVLGVAGSVQPVRAWIIGATQALWASMRGTSEERPLAPPSAPVRSASITFVPAGTQFLLEVRGRQTSGRLVISSVPGDSATTVVLGGSGTEDLVVLPAGLRIVNTPTSTASYEVRLPQRLSGVRIQVGTAAPVTFDPERGSLEIDLGRLGG